MGVISPPRREPNRFQIATELLHIVLERLCTIAATYLHPPLLESGLEIACALRGALPSATRRAGK
jgi:hypothetical protein